MLFESILDTTSVFLCVINSSGKIITVNSRFARLLSNKSREAVIGQIAADIVEGSTELKTFFQSLVTNFAVTKEFEPVVQPVFRNAEKPLWIKFTVSRIQTADNGTCLFITGADVSDEITAQREAEQKALERSGFLVRMGHELRTPLNTVLGYAQLLNGLDGLPPVAHDYISTILTNETTLLHLLNDVLELSKYEAGQMTPILSETNLKKMIQGVMKSYIDQFNAKNLSLTVDYKTDMPDIVLTDPQKMTHVFSNVIGNALKFTRKGGVSITISYDKLLTIDIEDTGIGIDQTDASQVFEIFGQAGSSKEHMTGTGIGLAIARIFARMLGGDVTLIRSAVGKGSLFRCTFDVQSVHSDKKNTQSISDYTTITGISAPCKVLLVDDVDINLAMLEIFLAPAGFEVSIAANGNEAVEKFKSFKPDIVFMDLIMPEKDGFEATREIKALNSKVPVIALTASIVDSIKEQALEAGVNDFMNKPFIPERFFEIIAEHTDIKYLMK